MAEPLKNIFDREFIEELADKMKQVFPGFNENMLYEHVFVAEWKNFELKQRMAHVAHCLYHQLPKPYSKAIIYVTRLVEIIEKSPKAASWGYMFIPDIIKDFGLEDLPESIKAMERITQFTSCEFAVRPFLLKYPEEMIEQMDKWSVHENEKVRRFSSEGARPRLPWAMAIPYLKEDPSPILSILRNLRNDPSEFVRKSVANNLNDISKDHPDIVIDIVKKWKGKTKHTDWILKHACRTLLKQGNQEALKLFGFASNDKISINEFAIKNPSIKLGEELHFSFRLLNEDQIEHNARIEYGIYYLRSNGTHSKKVFKLSERGIPANSQVNFHRKQSFRSITTRKYYTGTQMISIIINGKEFEKLEFSLDI